MGAVGSDLSRARRSRDNLRNTMAVVIAAGIVLWGICFGFRMPLLIWVVSVVALAVLILGWVSIRRAHAITLGEARDHVHPNFEDLDVDSLVLEIGRVQSDENIDSLDLLVNTLLKPTSVFSRISETAEIQEGHTNRLARFSLKFRTEGKRQYVALDLKKRGQLIDGLRVSNAEGKRVSSLSREDNAAILGAMLRELVLKSGYASYVRYVMHLEKSALSLVLSSSDVAPHRILVLLRNLSTLFVDERSNASLQFISAVRILSLFNPVIVEVGAATPAAVAPSRFAITTSYQVEEKLIVGDVRTPMTDPLGRVRQGLRPRLLAFFGMRDSVIFFPLASAARARSYHFQSDGPDAAFLEHQRLRDDPARLWYVLRPLEGQAFSHAYLRDARGVSRTHYQGKYLDAPPGAIGIASVAAASALLAVLVIGVQHLHWVDPRSSILNASLLLSLPGLVIAYLGFGRASTFLTGSVTARIVAALSLASTISAVVVSALIPRNVEYYPTRYLEELAIQGWASVLWISLFAAQVSVLIYACGTWFYRTWTYFDFLSKRGTAS